MEFQQIQRYGISLSKRRCFKISYCMKNLLCMVWPATCFFRSCEKNHKEFAGGGSRTDGILNMYGNRSR